MTRNELKNLWFSLPASTEITKTIVVEINKNPQWKGYGTIQIISDDQNGYRSFSTHQEFPMEYLKTREEYKSGEYQLIIK
tara:strand:+ start:88 stop:327 length:240 start_codon:yes stop_codon:yes gene_type:complete